MILSLQHSAFYEEIKPLQDCQLIVDGLFGFGLTRDLAENITETIKQLNSWSKPVVSIDLPSGIHTDTGKVLGIAVRATRTLCLGLWKLAYFQDSALEYLGQVERIDFGILSHHIWSVLPQPAPIQRITLTTARKLLPLTRPQVTHKYQQGKLLLICGSLTYAGGSILTALGINLLGDGMRDAADPYR